MSIAPPTALGGDIGVASEPYIAARALGPQRQIAMAAKVRGHLINDFDQQQVRRPRKMHRAHTHAHVAA